MSDRRPRIRRSSYSYAFFFFYFLSKDAPNSFTDDTFPLIKNLSHIFLLGHLHTHVPSSFAPLHYMRSSLLSSAIFSLIHRYIPRRCGNSRVITPASIGFPGARIHLQSHPEDHDLALRRNPAPSVIDTALTWRRHEQHLIRMCRRKHLATQKFLPSFRTPSFTMLPPSSRPCTFLLPLFFLASSKKFVLVVCARSAAFRSACHTAVPLSGL